MNAIDEYRKLASRLESQAAKAAATLDGNTIDLGDLNLAAEVIRRFVKDTIQYDNTIKQLSKLEVYAKHHLKWGGIKYKKDLERFLVLALAGEAGELANYVKKEWRDKKDFNKEKKAEIADIGNYALMLSILLGFNFWEEMEKKFKIVERRKNFKEGMHRGTRKKTTKSR